MSQTVFQFGGIGHHMPADNQVLFRCQVTQHASALHHMDKAILYHIRRFHVLNRRAVQDDRTGGHGSVFGFQSSGNRLERRAFPCPVSTEKRNTLTLAHGH